MSHAEKLLIAERRKKPTLALSSGSRELNLLSWQGLLAIASSISMLYAAAQIVGSITGLQLSSDTAKKIDKLAETIEAESHTRAAADSESRADRSFIRQQVGDLTLAVCGTLQDKASAVVRARCDAIITNTYNHR